MESKAVDTSALILSKAAQVQTDSQEIEKEDREDEG